MNDLDFEGIVLFIFGIVLAVAIFMGVTTAIRKTFTPTFKSQVHDSSETKSAQEKFVDDTEIRREKAMRDYKQKMRDFKRRF